MKKKTEYIPVNGLHVGISIDLELPNWSVMNTGTLLVLHFKSVAT